MFFSKNQADVLAFLFSHESGDRTLSEIGEAIGKHPGVFGRGVNALEKEGIIQSRMRGNQRLVSINKRYIFYHEVRTIIQKTVGAEGLLRTFARNETGVTTALIYGSYAKDTMRADSDIDLLLVFAGTPGIDDCIARLPALERKLGREINYKVYSQKEFITKIRAGDPFLEEILNDTHIMLKGEI